MVNSACGRKVELRGFAGELDAHDSHYYIHSPILFPKLYRFLLKLKRTILNLYFFLKTNSSTSLVAVIHFILPKNIFEYSLHEPGPFLGIWVTSMNTVNLCLFEDDIFFGGEDSI